MFEKLIARIGKILGKNKVPYMVIGGQALLLYGDPRLTKDVDITLGIGINHLDNILELAEEIGLSPLPEDVFPFVRKTMVLPVMDKPSGIRVDFIFSFTPYEKQAIERGNIVEIGNAKINFASVSDLIIHKIFAGRPRDLEDIENIILKSDNIEIDYIKKWLRKFDVSFKEGNYLKTFESILKENNQG